MAVKQKPAIKVMHTELRSVINEMWLEPGLLNQPERTAKISVGVAIVNKRLRVQVNILLEPETEPSVVSSYLFLHKYALIPKRRDDIDGYLEMLSQYLVDLAINLSTYLLHWYHKSPVGMVQLNADLFVKAFRDAITNYFNSHIKEGGKSKNKKDE